MSTLVRTVFHTIMIGIFCLITPASWAQEDETNYTAEEQAMIDLVNSFTPLTDDIPISEAYTTLKLPEGYTFYNEADTGKILTDLWGNPPGQDVLGSIFPPNSGPLDADNYSIIVSFDDVGYVKDEDAAKTNFDKLLKQMKKDSVASNEYRSEQGYPTVELLGWAAPPHYDSTNKRLVWAKELMFEGETDPILNYNLRVLGRYGVLEFNYIADKDQLGDIDNAILTEASMASFDEGSRYEDFNPATDTVAKYGIAGLIAGGLIAKKFGLIAIVLLFMKKGGILIFAAFAYVIKPIRRMLGKGDDDNLTS